MITIRQILCPTDFSEFSTRALQHAIALARWYEAKLTVLHVLPAFIPSIGEFPYLPNPALLDAREREQLTVELRGFAAPAGDAGVRFDTCLREGRPADEVVAIAESLPADLIAMGTHGRGGFERWVLGSVTEKVLRKAPCPVLAIPPGGAAPRELFRTILCATDFSPASAVALRYALSLAQEAQARLLLLHVLEGLPVVEVHGRLHFDVGDYTAQLRQQARDELRRTVPEEARDWCTPEEIVTEGKPWHQVLSVAREWRAELIVLGVHGRGALERMMFGSTAHHVVREAPCPVLTVRELRRVRDVGEA